MKLGDTALVTVNAPDLQASLSFYQKLGFRKSGGKHGGCKVNLSL